MEARLLDREEAKALMREVILEMLQERRSEFYALLAEALEDVALARAIEEGRKGEYVSKERLTSA